jgi:type IX secretion system PorP/SprF family membrane protein
MNKVLLLFLFLLMSNCSNAQKYILPGNYLLNGMIINPAYTGSREVFTINTIHRQQWVGFSGAPVYQVLTFHTPLKKDKIAIGMQLTNYKQSIFSYFSGSFDFAYRIFLSQNSKLSFGLQAKATTIRYSWNEIITEQSNDKNFDASNSNKELSPNAAFGIYYYSKKIFAGISIPELMSNSFELARTEQEKLISIDNSILLANAGGLVSINEKFKIKPSALLKYRKDATLQIDYNANLIFSNKFWVGASYRPKQAVLALFEIQANEQLKFGYTYEMNTNTIKNYNGGSHEIMLQYELRFKIKTSDPKFF